jgi:hypothetical protein
MALGASRARIIGQLIAESAILSLAGSVAGFLVAVWHWHLLDSAFVLRHWLGEIDRYVALVAAILSVALVGLFGVIPAFRTSSMRLEQVLRDARRSGMSLTRLDGLLARLVIGSTAATVVLLSSALLLGLSARELAQRQERGLKLQNVLSLDLSFDEGFSPRQTVERAHAALVRLAQLPGAQAAAIAPTPGGARLAGVSATPEGHAAVLLNTTEVRSITGGYFSALGVRLVAGRTFSEQEGQDSSGAVIIGATVAEQLWPGESAIGRRAKFKFGADPPMLGTVVGVVANVGDERVRLSQIYRPFGSAPVRQTGALVRFARAGDLRPAAATRAIRSGGGVDVTASGCWVIACAVRMRLGTTHPLAFRCSRPPDWSSSRSVSME